MLLIAMKSVTLAVPDMLCPNGLVAFTCITVTRPMAKPYRREREGVTSNEAAQ